MVDESIRRKFERTEYEYSLHAVDQSVLRRITRREIEQAIRYGPSALVCGRTEEGRMLHIQCTTADPPRVKIITVYEPDPAEWVDFRERRSE